MKARSRFLVAAALAAVLASGIVAGLVVRGQRSPSAGPKRPEVHAVVEVVPAGPAVPGLQTAAPQAAAGPAKEAKAPGLDSKGIAEKLIEEELAEVGEDPGAVFYMSRIREAIVEGNPTFARELLRQMKELHEGSALVAEAEGLFKDESRKGRGR
jgi:hypothetical protein